MWMLTLTSARLQETEQDIARLVREGRMTDALRTAQDRLELRETAALRRCDLGAIVLRISLAAGREEEAEELAQKMPRLYETVSRPAVRWLSSLDQGAMCLALNRPGRGAQAFNLVADDEAAPAKLRVEALAGLSIAMHKVGEYRRAALSLHGARELARREGLDKQVALLDGLGLDLAMRYWLRSCEEFDDVPLPQEVGTLAGRREGESLQACAARTTRALDDVVPAARRLTFLGALLGRDATPAVLAGAVRAQLHWLAEQYLSAVESETRVESALGFTMRKDFRAAIELLGSWISDEQQVVRHRHSLDLRSCLSRLHALQGRHGEALRVYKEFSRQAMETVQREVSLLPYSRFLERQEIALQPDAPQMRLPLRYRRAYQFIIERLDDRQLTIRQVAAHIDVSERALQAAFRTYLGMSPAELIRHHRMSRIRSEWLGGQQQSTVIEIGRRWGMGKRSTLVQNYRQQFSETPTATLRGSGTD